MRTLLVSTFLFAAWPALAAPTYDLRPLAVVEPSAAPLQSALSGRDSRQVRALAASLADASTVTAVRQAAWYVLNRRCIDDRRVRCPQSVYRAGAHELSAPFADVLIHDRARAAMRAKNFSGARAILASCSDALRETNRLLLSLAERSVQQPWSDAFAQHLEAIDGALTTRDRCRLMLVLGDKSSDGAGKWSAYRQVWRGACGPLRRAALERLVAIGMTPSPLERIDWLAQRRLPRKRRARRKAERLALRDIERAAVGVSGLATYGRGILYGRTAKRRAKALQLLRDAAKVAQDADVLSSAQYRVGDLLGKLGRDAEAISTLEPLLQMQLPPGSAAKVRWRLYRLYRAQAHWLDAERVLNDLVSGNSKWRLHALWELAWRRFRLHDAAEALRLFNELRAGISPDADDGKQPWHARIDYWRARCHRLLGSVDKATTLFASVVRRHPQTYYGMIAHDRLSAIDPVLATKMAAPTLSADTAPLDLARLQVQQHPLLDGPVLLLRLGLLRSALGMLRGIIPARLPRDGVHLLAALYHQTGNSRAAYAVLRRHARRAAAPDVSTAGVWRVAYKTPLLATFVKAADDAGVPRSLLFAVARHESHFVPTATSRAGAVGLVQLLPMVANRIADLYGLKKRPVWALRTPRYNLSLGARYLAQINSFVGGNHALVLAAYNAGPYAVRRWLKRLGDVPTDVFVESIPYRQARNYARGVLATAHAYAALHPDWGEPGRLAAGRRPRVPVEMGPFMVPPAAKQEANAAAFIN